MTFNTFLIQLVGFSSGLFLLGFPPLPKGWRMISGLILLVLGGSYWLVPTAAGWVSGGLWLLLVMLPLMGQAIVNRLVIKERYSRARRIASLVRWLHPMDGEMQYPTLLKGLELVQQGRMEEATQIFQRYQTPGTVSGRLATTLFYRTTARWDELAAWVQNQLPAKVMLSDTTVGILYLRSLGEIGDLNRLLQTLEQLERKLAKINVPLARMFAFAFCGQVDQVQKLLSSSLAIYPESVHRFWLATAELAAGQEAIARQQLLELYDRTDAVQRAAIDWRLSHSLANPEQVLTDASRTILLRLRLNLMQESQYSLGTRLKRKPYVTYSLIAANCLIFALEQQQGGSENTDVLYRLGALMPEAVFAGDWWRILSANFLHLNLLHLLSNMLGLYVLGKFVEARLGTVRFLLAYFLSGIGSMLTITLLSALANVPDLLCVGASGAIMGLLGVIAAILLRGWQQDKARVARNQLLWILGLVGLQVISDFMIPESSMVGHISGLILGFLVGYVLSAGRRSLR